MIPSRDSMLRRDSGAATIVGFMDFWEKVESVGADISDMEERDVLESKIMEGGQCFEGA